MISQSTPFAESALLGRRDYLDFGAGNARFEVYGGTRPASGATPGTPILVTMTLDKPCGDIGSPGQLELVLDATFYLASASGAPTWARFYNGDNAFAFDCDASGPGGGAEVVVSESLIYAGGKVALISAIFQ